MWFKSPNGFRIKYLYPLLLAAFPVLALFVNNYGEVGWGVVPRPLLLSLGIAGVALLAFRLLVKDWAKAALMTAWFLVTFFLYGHIRNWFLANMQELGRQRYMIPIWSVLSICGFLIIWKLKNITPINTLNGSISIILIAMLLVQLCWQQYKNIRFKNDLTPQKQVANITVSAESPDIYYIILDSYTRADVLNRQFSYENSRFIQDLETRGFFVADCSSANYPNTYSSLASSMNSSYLDEAFEKFQKYNLPTSAFGFLITDSWVGRSLAEAGYTIVGYETEWHWLTNFGADVLYKRLVNTINSFEFMLINTSSLVIVWDMVEYTIPSVDQFDVRAWTKNQLSIMEMAHQSIKIASPKFDLIHIAIPHPPYVFQVIGPVPNLDKSYSRAPYKKEYEGYKRQVEYINQWIIKFVDDILSQDKPAVIIIQGDHGSRIDDNYYEILNAYFFYNDNGYPDLYPSISPVNTFRVIFNRYFNTGLEILPDRMFDYRNEQYLEKKNEFSCEPGVH